MDVNIHSHNGVPTSVNISADLDYPSYGGIPAPSIKYKTEDVALIQKVLQLIQEHTNGPFC